MALPKSPIVQNSVSSWLADACAPALGAALVCALPTVIRSDQDKALVWLVSSALLLCLFLPLRLLTKQAAVGWRALTGSPRPTAHRLRAALWLLLASIGLATLAIGLRAYTHHKGLGGATFGVFGTVMVLASGLAALRVDALLRAHSKSYADSSKLLVRIAVGGFALLTVALSALSFKAEASPEVVAAQGGVVDLLMFAIVGGALLLRLPSPRARAQRRASVGLAFGLTMAGMITLESSSQAGQAVRRAGGLVGWIVDGMHSWSDRDHDGAGAHFGGHDCDDGDPARHPAAREVAADGVDTNCDGRDDPQSAEGPQQDRSSAIVVAVATAATGSSNAAASATKQALLAPDNVTAAPSASGRRPDIVLVTLDSVRADRTSAYGYRQDTTPNLKRLAERGLLFEHAYATGSDTKRALIPLVSGNTLAATAHTSKTWPRILDEVNTLAERLKAAGYHTAAVSSFTWLRSDRGFGQGFDVFDESPWQSTHPERESTGSHAIEAALENYDKMAKKSGPLYLWVHLFDAHRKFLRHPGIDFGKQDSGLYDGEIAFVDQALQKLVDHIESKPRAKQTVWMVHGSHGEAFGEHGQSGHGVHLYEEVLRVPLIIAGNGVKPGRYGRDAVTMLDVAPTIAELAGASRDGLPGISLRGALADHESFERAPVVAHSNRHAALIDWPMKIVSIRRKKRKSRLLLFDLSADPREQHDLSADKVSELRRLQRQLAAR